MAANFNKYSNQELFGMTFIGLVDHVKALYEEMDSLEESLTRLEGYGTAMRKEAEAERNNCNQIHSKYIEANRKVGELECDKQKLFDELTHKNKRIAKLNEDIEDLKDENEDWEDNYDELKEENERLNKANAELRDQYIRVKEANEKLSAEEPELDFILTCYRGKLEKLCDLEEEYNDLKEENERLKNVNVNLAKENVRLRTISQFHREEEFKAYCDHDISSTMDVASLYPKLIPVGKAREYGDFAKHIRQKYEALINQGFSHDDAMGLIPLWGDEDFKNFTMVEKKDGLRTFVSFIDETKENNK